MTVLEHFNNEVEHNKEHKQFIHSDDDLLGFREEGYYVCIFRDNRGQCCQRYVFDDGECFIMDEEKNLRYICKIPEDAFIHKFLEKIVYDFINDHKIKDSEVPPTVYCSENKIEVPSFIRLVLNKDEHIVALTNIILPRNLRRKGLGLKIISEIYQVCNRLKYRLLLSMMVESFYDRMLARGAKVISYDELEITDSTCLGPLT